MGLIHYADEGFFAPAKIAEALHTTSGEIARTAGLGRDAVQARTQAFARALAAKGYRALLVRSLAPGAVASDLNLVLWAWGEVASARLVLIDDEGRLSL